MARGENLATKATAGLERGADRIAGPRRGGREPRVSGLEGGPGKDSCRGQTAAPGSPKGRGPPSRSGPSAEPLCARSRRHDQRDRPAGSGPRLRPEQRGRLGRRDRPADVQGRRTFRRGRAAATRHAVARPEDSLCERRRRQHADADRCAHRSPRQADPRRRSLQPLFHDRRALRDRGRRASPPTRLPLGTLVPARAGAERSLCRRQPHGLLCRRALCHRKLRVLGPSVEGRRAPLQGPRGANTAAPVLGAAGRALVAGREGFLRSRPRCRRSVGDQPQTAEGDRFHPHRRRSTRSRRRAKRKGALRRKSQRGKRVRDLVQDPQGHSQVAHPGRRKPRHGRRLRGWQGALALGTVQLGGLCNRHAQRTVDHAHSSWSEPTRPVRLAAAGEIFTRSHGEHALMTPRVWLRTRADLLMPAAAAASLAALLVWFGPPGTDLAAHVYQRTLFLEHGFVLWNNFWYAGRYSFVTYSVLYYPLAAAIGIKLLAVLIVAAAVAAFAAVVRHEWELHSRWTIRAFAVVWALLVVSAAYPFMLGMALALLSLWSLQLDHRWVFACLTLLTLAASPLAFLLLVVVLVAVALARRGEPHRFVAPAVAIASLGVLEFLMRRMFPGRGSYPFSPEEFLAACAFCLIGVALTWKVAGARLLRWTYVVYLAACTAAFTVSSPVGENIARLRFVAAPL